ncbi:sigma-54 dependent transcriptional regulator [Falsochrobactrum sp. TDYN1]|uniref:DNA-binding transcriptional regulator NtrC n=1 Tax=Falsochrobactrum tianjinense TaxID=2706015 RepID=A0A949UTX4_9HYPH|nr:sigma-54 dependent transcriptional regulator [Falsochrobactrum sp. TDYN1]MBV2144285.1 sigma-54 dependent transcriptional regulator [Falsochrobactrum sp. TDYN1]
MSTRILIADDDPIHRRNLEAAILRMGYRTLLADGGLSTLGFISSRKDISLILLDLAMPDMDGYTVLARMRNANINIPVLALVQNEDMQKAMRAIKLGAADFVTKPVAFERLQISVANAFKLDALTHEVKRTRSSLKTHILLSDMVTKSPEMGKVAILARRVTALDTPLLIEGEVGTGKETLARAICCGGARWQAPFVSVDCRSLTPENAEEELFGQSVPSSCATRDSDPIKIAGKLVGAHGGILFLDEVGELPYRVQLRLFKAIQADPVSALSDARIIASSSCCVFDLVQMGRFHAGLYHWLASYLIKIPSLRNRIEDIPILAHRFMVHFAGEERLGHITGIKPFALELLKNYNWPGNVRELKNTIFQAVLLCEENALSARDFRHAGLDAGLHYAGAAYGGQHADERANGAGGVPLAGEHVRHGSFSGVDTDGEVRTLAAAEEEMIRFAISHYDGQISEVARRLGIGRTTLYRKLKDYGIDVASIAGKGRSEGEDRCTPVPGRVSNG